VPFVNNVIPSQRESPLAKKIWGITPLPTDPGANPLVTTNLKVAVPTNGSPTRPHRPPHLGARQLLREGKWRQAHYKLPGNRRRHGRSDG